MSGSENVAEWIAGKLKNNDRINEVRPLGSGLLELVRKDGPAFVAAAIGEASLITADHVAPLFGLVGKKPEFVVNVPSKAIWSGSAINLIHKQPAAFGTLGELEKAVREEHASSYRNKEYSFFERAFQQHNAVIGVTRIYDKVFEIHRSRGLPNFTVALVDAYDMSAEDVRNAREKYGNFDAALKITSYGSITTAANQAAETFGATATNLKDLMSRLNKR